MKRERVDKGDIRLNKKFNLKMEEELVYEG